MGDVCNARWVCDTVCHVRALVSTVAVVTVLAPHQAAPWPLQLIQEQSDKDWAVLDIVTKYFLAASNPTLI